MTGNRSPYVLPSAACVHLVVILVVACLAATAGAAAPVTLTLRERVVVDQEQVRLDDIASVAGGEEARQGELGQAVVADSPLPGQTRFVSLDYIRIRLRQAGFDTDAMTFKGASDVRLTRRAATLPTDAIERAVETAIRSRMPWKDEHVTIGEITVDDDIQLPTGRLSYTIDPHRNEDYLGRVTMAMQLFVDDVPVRKIWVHATLSVMADVVAVVRPLGKHQPIERDDLAVVRRNLADLPADTVRRLEDALGNRTTRVIYSDTVLQAGMFVAPPLVRRGDIVKIVVNAGPMTITATGMVKQQGAKGDLVRVVNTDSNRIITARVTGPGAVAIDF